MCAMHCSTSSMTETLEGAGVDPDRTPVDRLPEAAQWALANALFDWESPTAGDLDSDYRTSP